MTFLTWFPHKKVWKGYFIAQIMPLKPSQIIAFALQECKQTKAGDFKWVVRSLTVEPHMPLFLEEHPRKGATGVSVCTGLYWHEKCAVQSNWAACNIIMLVTMSQRPIWTHHLKWLQQQWLSIVCVMGQRPGVEEASQGWEGHVLWQCAIPILASWQTPLSLLGIAPAKE